MELVKQILIALLTTSLGSVLTYLAAIKKSKAEIKAVEIKAENEIKKIESEYKNQIKKIKVETEELIKLKIADSELLAKENTEKIKNEAMSKFFSEFMKDPKKGAIKLEDMKKIVNNLKQ